MVNVVGLHGFWGAPNDFDELCRHLGPHQTWAPDLFTAGDLDSSHDLASWSENFLTAVRRRFSEPVYLVGYSQGARLALHAHLRAPELFAKSFFLSAHPGQLSPTEKENREDWIRDWRRKFETAEWPRLEREWNDQPTLQRSGGDVRRQPDRQLLSLALENWSLLQHRFGWPELRSLNERAHWVFGASDHKFLAVKERLRRENVGGHMTVIDGAGHRLLLDAPKALAELMGV